MFKFIQANEKKLKKLAHLVFSFTLGLLMLLYIWNKAFSETVRERNEAFLHIAMNETELYFHELKFFTENKSKYFVDLENPKSNQLMQELSTQEQRILDIYLVNRQSLIVHSLNNTTGWLAETTDILPFQSRVWISKQSDSVPKIYVASPIIDKDQQTGHLVISFSTQDFLKRLLHVYSGTNYKIAMVSKSGLSILWPFSQTRFEQNDGRAVFDGNSYIINRITLNEPWIDLYLFQEEQMQWFPFLLLPALLILTVISGTSCFIYCYWKKSPMSQDTNYFKMIDLNDFNELKTGMIFADDNDTIQFANKAVRMFFQGKQIIAGKTILSQLLPNLKFPRGRLIIQSGHRLVNVRHYVVGLGSNSYCSIILFNCDPTDRSENE